MAYIALYGIKMTTLTQIRQDFEKIAKKAKDNYAIFQYAAPKTKEDEGQVKGINFLKKVQNFPDSFKLEGFYAALSQLVDPTHEDPDKDIERFIDSLPEDTTEQLDKKIEAKITLKKVTQGIRLLNIELEGAIKHLNANMDRMTPAQYQVHQATVKLNQDAKRHSELVTIVSKEQLPLAPEHTKNPTLNQAYSKMKLAYEQMKQLGLGNKSLETGKNYETAVYLLESNIEQYKKYEKAYQTMLTLQQQAEKNVRTATLESEQLLRKYKEVVDKFPKGTPVLDLPEKKLSATDDDISYIDKTQLIYADILKHSDKVRAITEQMEIKYKVDLQTAQKAVVQKAKDIGDKLSEIGQLITRYKQYLSKEHLEKLDEKYTKIQNRNNETLQTSAHSNELNLVKAKEKEITDLVDDASQLENDILSKISKNMTEQYSHLSKQMSQRIALLKGKINQEHYSEYHSFLNEVRLPVLSERMSLTNLTEHFNELEQIRAQVDSVETAYESTKSSVDLILYGLQKSDGAEFLQTTLSFYDSVPKVAEVLSLAAQQSSARQIAHSLTQIKFSELTRPITQGIHDYIRENNNSSSSKDAPPVRKEDLITINEKLKCYKWVQTLADKERYLPLVDDKTFRQTLLFLRSHDISVHKAITLIDTKEKRQLLLKLQHNCNPLSAEQIQGILSSPTKSQAAIAIFDKMQLPKRHGEFQGLSIEDQRELYTQLMSEVVINEHYAQATINLQDNHQLFNSVLLLSLAKFDPQFKVYDSTIDFLIEKLNSSESLDYQTVLKHSLQSNYSPHFEKDFYLLKVNAHKQLGKVQELQHNPIPIKKLAKAFEQINELFSPLIKKARQDDDDQLEAKLQATQRGMFSEFIQNKTWEEAIDKSIEIVQDKLKDERSILQIVLDGFNKIIEKISNWWNNIESPKSQEPIEAKQINSRFKAEMDKIRGDDLAEGDVRYKTQM